MADPGGRAGPTGLGPTPPVPGRTSDNGTPDDREKDEEFRELAKAELEELEELEILEDRFLFNSFFLLLSFDS